MTTKRVSFIGEFRRAARECGLSQNALARATGLDVAAVNRFISGRRGLSMKSLDTLADVLRLHIVSDGPPKARPKGKTSRPPTGKAGRPPTGRTRKEG